jgi:hypothetical protein
VGCDVSLVPKSEIAVHLWVCEIICGGRRDCGRDHERDHALGRQEERLRNRLFKGLEADRICFLFGACLVLGLTGEDCPAFEGVFEFCSISAGGSIGSSSFHSFSSRSPQSCRLYLDLEIKT